tara:strand:- start:525 stop:815 length:291 start_codon:yes stop_codon:yes gene_type:complete
MPDKDIITRSAIRTRYHGATNYTGARISATNGVKRIFAPYNYSLNTAENHCVTAQTFFDKDERFYIEVKKVSGLCFEGDYYWTWDILGEKETNMSS